MEVPPWLFSVDVEVSAQTEDERRRAAQEGLLTLLTRLTGLVSIPRNDTIRAALGAPQRYYNQYVFDSKRVDGVQTTVVRLTYAEPAMTALIKQAQLPVWGARRPRIVAWIAVEVDGQRGVLDAASDDALAIAFMDRARLRGLPVILPEMDEQDTFEVSADDVWRRSYSSLQSASARYGTDIVLVGRVRRNASGLSADWRYWMDGSAVSVPRRQGGESQIVQGGIDRLVSDLTSRFAVLPRSLRQHRLQIYGVDDTASYAAMMSHLRGMEFIDDIAVERVEAERLQIAITSRAEPGQLLTLLTLQGRLAEYDALGVGLGVKLKWQG